MDALQNLGCVGADGPVGFWGGVSLGSAIGMPLAVAEPRISGAAVFGLAGREALVEAASQVTILVEFLPQWDDELVPRDSGLAVFGSLRLPREDAACQPRPPHERARELESSERFSSPVTSSKAQPLRRPGSRQHRNAVWPAGFPAYRSA
ncbi:hypothetical protein [Streptomyces hypolithicus]